jgi:hypothetical protein
MARSDMAAEDWLAQDVVDLLRWASKHLNMLSDEQLHIMHAECMALGDLAARACEARRRGERLPEDQPLSAE